MATAHPDFGFYFQMISGVAGQGLFGPWAGDVFRSTLPRWVSKPYRFSGAGALLAGGRWNNKRLICANYFSTDAATVAAEADAKAIRYGWPPQSLRPQTRIVIELSLQHVLDLTSPAVQAMLRLTTAELTNCDWEAEQTVGKEAMTQAIGRAVFECAGEAMIVPSARRQGGLNVVHFPGHRRDGSTLMTRDEGNIPFMHGL